MDTFDAPLPARYGAGMPFSSPPGAPSSVSGRPSLADVVALVQDRIVQPQPILGSHDVQRAVDGFIDDLSATLADLGASAAAAPAADR